MALYTRSIVVPFRTATVDTVDTHDLPVNPLSFLLLHLRFLNAGANVKATVEDVLAMLDRLSVIFKGNNVLSLSGEDLFAYAYLSFRRTMHQVNDINTDNGVRSYTIAIPFGPIPFHPVLAFPATSRGNLQIELDWAAAFSNLDTVTYSIEAVELPDAVPTHFHRVTTLSHTPAAVGDLDIALPIGNPLVRCIFFGTTVPNDTTRTHTLNTVEILIDNQQRYVSGIDWDSLHNAMGLRAPPVMAYNHHTHMENVAGAYAQFADSSAAEYEDDLLTNYGLIDFDPLDDGAYLLDTAGLAELKARINAGAATALRILPVELFTVGA